MIFRVSKLGAIGAMLLSAVQTAVRAEVPECGLTAAGTARVTAIVDGDTVELDDGSEVRLVGTQAPKLPLGRRGFETWPLAPEAKAALSALTLGKTVELRYGGERTDRHGRRLAHLVVAGEDPVWVQGEMVSAGLARTYSFADNRGCVRELLARESEARAAGKGVWDLDYYRVRKAADPRLLLRRLDSFELVEGRVLDAAEVRGRVFLNFGPNHRDDFTAVVNPGDVRRFPGGAEGLVDLKGRTVRVRGWLESRNGPSIEVTHPEQIEVLE